MRRVGRCCLAVLIASLGWFACGASARAAASGAPQTFEESQCTEFSPGYVYCYGSKFFVHQAVAPSGNVALQVRYVQWQSTLFDGTYVYNEATSHSTQLVRDEQPQHFTVRDTNDTFYTYPDGTVFACTYHVFLHFANGEYQFNRVEFECPA